MHFLLTTNAYNIVNIHMDDEDPEVLGIAVGVKAGVRGNS